MKSKGMKLGAIFAVMLIVGMAFVPAVSAKAEKSKYDVLLEPYGFTVNNFETKITEQYQIGDQFVFSGDFKLNVEKNIDDELRSLKSKGTFNGVFEADGSIHTEYSGDDFKLESDIVKVGESFENFTYQLSEIITYKGNTKIIEQTFEVPKQDVKTISNPDDSGTVNALLTKYNVPSHQPPSSILIYNNLQYSELIVDIILLAAIAALIPGGLTVAGVLALIAAALTAIPYWLDVDPDNIYLDVFYVYSVPSYIYLEVDYFYY